ncbi:hypothetical protein [Chlamydia psittaci]|uniref:hypothetical protein n=1 Tax=Chlamydia psittaci TaxID=83554 RepID=UPI0001F37289|nr:hypothetical protein [Chlamydia psittaci]AFS19802.1 hypothetical protein B595_0847 [Chlamydia psittaci 84/55]EPJ16350.1 hypothetical protein CP02DC18_0131 [Chlamydia psittaci 02DC18]EPJ17652.1 hypothetical protein CP02DC22_0121 [Chlamydia psittaci 02DC22]EPJ20264.1 hypothetical protein CP02DC23_0475 [Chlamydia psittaci 02DC23]EPJ20549.1 hypothetical protein CP03DC29_0921 [Chlamydia psittaci 03DC29]EPJ21464.1 hypothetical protein CP02DC21_0118 [Chlamydia psittaci 02DC21]EPL00520.1 hypothet
MNTPLPSAVPSTNVTLKEDASASSSASTSCSVLKTAAGDVVLSIFSSEGSAPASLSSLATLALAQISAIANENTHLFQDCAHNLVFLSPETIDIEIQIADLLQTLETLTPQTTNEEKTSYKQQEQSLLNKGYEPQEVAPRSAKDIQGSSKTLQQPAKTFSNYTSAKTSDSRPWANSSTILHNSEQFTSRASHSSTPSQQPRTEKDSDLISYQSYPAYTTEKKEQQIFTTKSQESKQDREDRDQKQDQQRNGQHQEENNQEKQREKHYKSQFNVDKSKKISSQLSIEQLRYFEDVRQSRNINVEEEKTFKRKAQSPMSLFASGNPTQGYAPIQTPKIENVFIRFMKLMARILGQAEAEAQELYLRVKERTDNVDTLTLLLSKINSEKGAIDWRDNPEMKALVEQARKLDVTISDTLQWTEEEKKLLKENIQMRKENMEKITQLERTDMQRHLQEVSQCHQARSNVLKLLKELMDTFIYNLRP